MTYRAPFGDAYVHVCNRGVKKMPIFRHEEDLWRLLGNLFYLNHQEKMPENWNRTLKQHGLWTPGVYIWPEEWGVRIPLVSVLGFCIMPNHFHLILKELIDKGIPRFMHRVSMSYSKYINEKYNESGGLFEGAYRARILHSDEYLRYAAVYVMVKNPFELGPGGLTQSIENFEESYERARAYPFASLDAYAGGTSSIIDKDILGEIFGTREKFKEFAHDCMLYKLEHVQEFEL